MLIILVEELLNQLGLCWALSPCVSYSPIPRDVEVVIVVLRKPSLIDPIESSNCSLFINVAYMSSVSQV